MEIGSLAACDHTNFMSKEIVINSDGQTTRIAIVEDGELAELFIETEEHERTIGNLFLGKVRRIMPSIQAAFVDVGQKSDAFLHFSDLGESLPDWLEYASQEKPQIAKFASGSVQPRGRKRRRPVRGRGRRRLEDDAMDPEVELAEEQAVEGETEDGGTAKRGVVGSAGRGRRKAGQKLSEDSRRRSGRGGRDGSGDSRGDDNGVPPESFLKRDQQILVKISKEPIAQKGSRVTTDISLAGRFMVLVPMANYVAVSKKVSSFKERRRLRALAKMLLPDGFGVIVRTVAEGQNAKALDTDLRLLKEKWESIERRLAERPKAPAPVHEDVNMVSSIMRDLFSDNFDRILIDDEKLYRNLKGYVQAIAPDMARKVKRHEAKVPVFRVAGIERSVGEAFESRVNLPSGGYLYLEQTEAMHVVDVNSGRAGRGLSQEDNSLKVNIEAAKVISRQIRLRDLGGILVIDFIDMRSERSRRKVYDQMRREFRRDRAVTKVLPMSDFGLMQITRQRLRPSITHTFSDLHEDYGQEEVEAPTVLATVGPERSSAKPVDPGEVEGRIEDWLDSFKVAKWKGAIRLKVHPFTAAYLTRGLLPYALRCMVKYRMRVVVEEHAGMPMGRFRFFDETNGKEIRRPPRRGRKKAAEAGASRQGQSERKARQEKSTIAEQSDSAQRSERPDRQQRKDSGTAERSSRGRGGRRGRSAESESGEEGSGTESRDGGRRRESSGRSERKDSRGRSSRGSSDRSKAPAKNDDKAVDGTPESGRGERSERSGRSSRSSRSEGSSRGGRGRGERSKSDRQDADASESAGRADRSAAEEVPSTGGSRKTKGRRASETFVDDVDSGTAALPALAVSLPGDSGPIPDNVDTGDTGDTGDTLDGVDTGADVAPEAAISEEAPAPRKKKATTPRAKRKPKVDSTEDATPEGAVQSDDGNPSEPSLAEADGEAEAKPKARRKPATRSKAAKAKASEEPVPESGTTDGAEASESAGPDTVPGDAPSESGDDSRESGDSPSETVGRKTPAVQPLKLRYSSGHRKQSEPTPTEET